MNEFMLIFRLEKNTPPSPEQIQERMNWLAGIAAQGKLVDKGNTLSAANAKTVRSRVSVTDGPFTEIKEFVSGYIIIRTDTIDDAVEIAKANPIFSLGGNIEVREILRPDQKK